MKRVALVPEELDNQICSTGYAVLRPKPALHPRYLFYWLFTKGFSDEIASLQRGASYPAVSDMDVRQQPIQFPQRAEQERIVAILDEAFQGIATVRANIESAIQSLQALFSGELHALLATEHNGWRSLTLDQVSIDFGRGKSRHRPRNDPKLYGGDYPFIQTATCVTPHNSSPHTLKPTTQRDWHRASCG